MTLMHFDVFWSFRSPYSYLATGRLVATRARVRRRRADPAGAADRRPHSRLLPAGEPAVAAVPDARHDAHRRVRGHRLRLAAARSDRAGLRDARGGGGAAVHLPPDAARRRRGRARPRPAVHRRGVADHLERRRSPAGTRARISPRRRRAPGSTSPRWMPRSLPTPPATTRSSQANQRELEAAGHWGVPTMVFDGEPFFGQDRIDLLLWRMRQHGLSAARMSMTAAARGTARRGRHD